MVQKQMGDHPNVVTPSSVYIYSYIYVCLSHPPGSAGIQKKRERDREADHVNIPAAAKPPAAPTELTK